MRASDKDSTHVTFVEDTFNEVNSFLVAKWYKYIIRRHRVNEEAYEVDIVCHNTSLHTVFLGKLRNALLDQIVDFNILDLYQKESPTYEAESGLFMFAWYLLSWRFCFEGSMEALVLMYKENHLQFSGQFFDVCKCLLLEGKSTETNKSKRRKGYHLFPLAESTKGKDTESIYISLQYGVTCSYFTRPLSGYKINNNVKWPLELMSFIKQSLCSNHLYLRGILCNIGPVMI